MRIVGWVTAVSNQYDLFTKDKLRVNNKMHGPCQPKTEAKKRSITARCKKVDPEMISHCKMNYSMQFGNQQMALSTVVSAISCKRTIQLWLPQINLVPISKRRSKMHHSSLSICFIFVKGQSKLHTSIFQAQQNH